LNGPRDLAPIATPRGIRGAAFCAVGYAAAVAAARTACIPSSICAIADQHAACLERLVPLEAELLPVQGALRRETDAFVAPRVLATAAVLGIERDRARDAADGQVPGEPITVPLDPLDPCAAKPDLGEVLHVEEVSARHISPKVKTFVEHLQERTTPPPWEVGPMP